MRNCIPIEKGRDNSNFDVFILYMSEDKDEILRTLANALRMKKVKVWYDEFELSSGDSLRTKIEKGFTRSCLGIVILSKAFIREGWSKYELDGIICRTNIGEQIMLPIWHGITKQELIDFSPSLAEKLARNTTSFTVEEIASEIGELIYK